MVLLKKTLVTLGIVFVLVLSGCLVAQKLGLMDKPRHFSHVTHGEDEDLECLSCHTKVAKSDEAGMPSMTSCVLCHEGIDEDKPENRQLKAIYGDSPVWSNVTKLPEEVIFSHKLHHDAEIECATCHKGIEKSKRITDRVRVDMAACTKCHAQKETVAKIEDKGCKTCHENVTEEWTPVSHRYNWSKFHGGVVRRETGKTADNCMLCHTETTCVSCHQETPPENHNNHWRQRGHLAAATMDRQNCATCHRVDFCNRCHQEAEPRNHTASFGSPRNQHCVTCHTPLKNESCLVCHKSDPSHLALAPSLPNDFHSPALNCRQCHGLGLQAPLRHPDNGDSCTQCHK